MSEWISVKDRFPEGEEEVLIYEVGEMYIATYTIKLFFTDFDEDNVAIRHPSHWMPLPESPEQPEEAAEKNSFLMQRFMKLE